MILFNLDLIIKKCALVIENNSEYQSMYQKLSSRFIKL